MIKLRNKFNQLARQRAVPRTVPGPGTDPAAECYPAHKTHTQDNYYFADHNTDKEEGIWIIILA